MKFVLHMIACIFAFCTFAKEASNSSPSPAFLSSEKHEKNVYDHAMDRLNIERERGRHGAHLHVQQLTAGGNHLIKVAKSGAKYVLTCVNCRATTEEKQIAKQNWQTTKAEGFSAARENKKHANKVISDSFTNQKNIQQDIRKMNDARTRGQPIPQDYQHQYNEASNKLAAQALQEEKSANWSQGQYRSRMARKL